MEEIAPGVSLCMIVRDEEENLPRCLDSVAGLVDEIVLVDTGSADHTVSLARSYGARVFRLEWPENFAMARNFSLDQATRQWIFCLDADEELAPAGRASFRPLLAREGVEGYLSTILNLVDNPAGEREILRHSSLRLFRNRPGYRFRGPLHEEILTSIRESSPQAVIAASPVEIIHHGYTSPAKAARNKAGRNLGILRQALAGNPGDLFLQYNLGLEYWQLGDFPAAARWLGQVYAGCGREWPHAAALTRNYAICLLELGDPATAVAVLEQGAARFPAYTDLFYLLAVAHRRLGQPEKAVELASRCLELGEPPAGYVSTWGVGGHKACMLAGEMLEELEDYEQAARAYTVALQRHPQYVPALFGLVRVLGRLYDAQGCVSYLEQYFDFSTARAVEVLLEALATARMNEAGLLVARKAVRLWPENQRLRLLLARALMLREREVLAAARGRFRGVPVLEREWYGAALALERLEALISGRKRTGGEAECPPPPSACA